MVTSLSSSFESDETEPNSTLVLIWAEIASLLKLYFCTNQVHHVLIARFLRDTRKGFVQTRV